MGWSLVRPSGAVTAMVTAAGVAHFTIAALDAGRPPAPPSGVLASIALTDDEGGQALFPATVLLPDRPASRCVRVGYSGRLAADQPGVRLAARDLRGTLVPRLAIKIEIGTGGGFASCTGFHGRTVYTGALAGLGAPGGVDTAWTPAPGDARTYRITVTMTEAAPDGYAAATLEWSASATTPAAGPVLPAVSTSPSSPAAPGPSSVSGPSTVPGSVAAPAPAVGGAPSTARPATPARAGNDADRRQICLAPEQDPNRGWGARAGKQVERVVRAVADVAARSGRDSGYPAGLVILLLLFLLLQRRIDRRDPKLALAPLTADRYAYLPDYEEHVLVRPLRPAVPTTDPGGNHGHR